LDRGYLTDEHLQRAVGRHAETGGRLADVLVDIGVISESRLARAIEEAIGVPLVILPRAQVEAEALTKVPAGLALEIGAFPFHLSGDRLRVAFNDPLDALALEEVEDASGCTVEPYQALSAELAWALATYYPELGLTPPEDGSTSLGELAREAGLLTQAHLEGALYKGDEGRLGETLLQSNRLSREQLRRALAERNELGRVKPLGESLVDLGYVTKDDLNEALRAQRLGGRLEDTLVQSGKVSSEMLARSLAAQLGYEFVEEGSARVDPFVVTLVPEGTVRRYNVMPIRLEGNALLLAMKDPHHVFALDDIKLITGREIRPAVATEETLVRLINRSYRSNEDMEELAKAVLEEVGDKESFDEQDANLDDTALVKVVNNIIREAILNDISDIHLEPRPDEVVVRVRKDGALREYMTMPKGVASAVAARIKIMGRLNIAERRLPQDGRVRFKDKNIEVDLRLSTLPTVYGEKVVLRILKKASSIPEIEQLGFADYNFERFNDTITKPYGIFLITGPTGSGKSFTTFSILKRVATAEVNVTTVEDPVEYEIPGINQTQVNVKAGLTFANALRSFLRQDPDVIMIGEIRDTETAKIAVEAALTGHLVIATLHTNDAAGAVTRLTEMGVEPFNISASLLGVLAQRLVRRVCSECRVAYTPDPDVLRRIGLSEAEIRGKTLYRGVGCEKCSGSGYNGRYAVHELLSVDDLVEAAIVQGRSSTEIKEIAIESGMRTLRDDGVFKAFAGVTTLEEVLTRTTD